MRDSMMISDDLLVAIITDIAEYACTNIEDKTKVSEFIRNNGSDNKWLLDSLSTHQVISFVADFFDIKDTGVLNHLVTKPSLEHLLASVRSRIDESDITLTFYTSGTTGKPKAVRHRLIDLRHEANQWRALLGQCERIYCCVPVHHIYGFIWAILNATEHGAALTDVRKQLLSRLEVTEPSLLIAVPSMVELLLMMPTASKQHTTLVLSTQPCDMNTLIRLKDAGFKQVIQIYGSTETGGIGWRDSSMHDYRLRTDLLWINQRVVDNEGHPMAIQDSLQFSSDTDFSIGSRHDRCIQVNGYNVDSKYVRGKLLALPNVKDAVVSIVEDCGKPILKATLTTKESSSLSQLLDTFDPELKRALLPQHVEINH